MAQRPPVLRTRQALQKMAGSGPRPQDQGRGQAGPADVQFGQVPPGGAQVGGNVASHGRLRDVGRGEANRGHRAGVQVAPYVPLVPVEQHRPGLAAVPPVRILHADRRSRATPRRSASAGPEQSTSWSRTWRATATAAAATASPSWPAMNAPPGPAGPVSGPGPVPGSWVIPVRVQRRLQAEAASRAPRPAPPSRRSLQSAPPRSTAITPKACAGRPRKLTCPPPAAHHRGWSPARPTAPAPRTPPWPRPAQPSARSAAGPGHARSARPGADQGPRKRRLLRAQAVQHQLPAPVAERHVRAAGSPSGSAPGPEATRVRLTPWWHSRRWCACWRARG